MKQFQKVTDVGVLRQLEARLWELRNNCTPRTIHAYELVFTEAELRGLI